MRILYSHRIQSRDGQSVHVEELIHALRDAGHEVLVVGPGFYEQAEFGGENRSIAAIRRLLPVFVQELAEVAYNIPATWRLWRAWRAFRPDLIYERYNLHFLSGSILARVFGATMFLEVNAPLAEERSKFGGLTLRGLAGAVERFTWRSATLALPVTQVLGRTMVEAGTDPDRSRIVPNGIVLDRFPPRPERGGTGPVVLGFAGFVRDWHGLDTIVDGLARDRGAKNVTLVVVGDGPARPALEQQAKALGIAGRVRFSGIVPHDQVAARVMEFDIALQPAVTPYASPLKIFDYMAAGCAIVAPDQPNIREILEHEHTALLFDPNAEIARSEAIQRLVMDPALRRRLGAAARAELEERRYTWAGNAERVAAWAAEIRNPSGDPKS